MKGVTRRSIQLAAALAACCLLAPRGALACTSDPECDDGLFCNGTETCNIGTSTCEPGTPQPDNVICEDGDDCTLGDTCQSGVCTGGDGADSDGDGDCDDRESECGCNPNDPQEVCHLPNRIVGRIGNGPGEVLLEYHSPTVRRVSVPTDASCATAGQCVDERCATGKVRDVCTVDADCNQPPLTCRVIVNYGDVSDLVLEYAKLGVLDVSGFTPATRGCSRKVDVAIDPVRSASRYKFRAAGTVAGRTRHDRESLRFIK